MPEKDRDEATVEPRTTPPGEGERRAIGGYYPQYRVAAALTLRGLRDGTLDAIRLADPEAGRIDDIQIIGRTKLDAFQVKWSRYGEALTFRDLTRPEGSSPPLIAQLGEGWNRLRAANIGKRVVVHLVTNRRPSANDHIVGSTNQPAHTAAFIEEAWRSMRHHGSPDPWQPPSAWASTWEALREASTLTPTEFSEFVRDCELEFGYELPGAELSPTTDSEIFAQDLQQLVEALFAAVFDPSHIIELTRNDLLARVGWRERVEFRSQHEFPVDEQRYEPIAPSVAAFHAALDSTDRGYLGLIGSPGSGKSSLLTHSLRSRTERVIRYFAYVPDAQDPLRSRGEATNFLHDLVLAIEQAGFRTGESLSRFDREQLRARLHAQLELLHKNWRTSGRKTIIAVDGLDHIARELQPQRSLLRDLPLPEQVPDGVLIVLGSQTDQLDDLSGTIRGEIASAGRRIEMRPLTRDAVHSIVGRAPLPVRLGDQQVDRVWRLSEGHPLALGLLLNALHGAADVQGLAALLDEAVPYDGDIERQYYSHWTQVEPDDELAHLVGLIARLRRVIDLEWIESWASAPLINRFRRRFAQFFRKETATRWYFYHNSFRLFLVKRTQEAVPGMPDPARNEKFHRELADRCESSSDRYWKWEEVYHRVAAGQHDVVIERATPAFFRGQVFAFRPIEAITSDIRLALRSVAAREDVVALARLNFAAAEMNQRNFHLEDVPLADLLISIGEPDIAIEHLRDGNALRVNQNAALGLSLRLFGRSLLAEARTLFDLAEPLDMIAASTPIEGDLQHENQNLLEGWAEVVPSFRNFDEVLACIRRLQYRDRNGKDETTGLRRGLLFHVGLGLLRANRWDDFEVLLGELKSEATDDSSWWFWLSVRAWKHALNVSEDDRARVLVERVTRQRTELQLGPIESVVLAEALYRICDDIALAKTLVADLGQPNLVTDLVGTRDTMAPFLQRFRLNRLLYAFGASHTVVEAVPDAAETRHQPVVFFERGLTIIAKIWSESWRRRPMERSTLVREARPLLRLFNRDRRHESDWIDWHSLLGLREEFYKLLVQAAAKHGGETLDGLAEEFDTEWMRAETKAYWPVPLRRAIILTFFRAGKPHTWTSERLRALEGTMAEEQDAKGRVDECEKQAEAWLVLGDVRRARTEVEHAVRNSFGVGYRKDYQLDDWIGWLTSVNALVPHRAEERIAWLARAIPTLDEATEGRAAHSAAIELLKACFRWSPRRTIALFNFFIDHRVIRYHDALAALLIEGLKNRVLPLDIALHCAADFLVTLDSDGHEALASELVRAAAPSERATTARYLVERVSTWGLASTRSNWRRGLAREMLTANQDLRDGNLTDDDLKPGRDSGRANILRLVDGAEIDEREVVARIDSLAALETLVTNEATDSYFKWEPVIECLGPKFDVGSVDRLASLLRARRRSALTLSALSEVASNLGDRGRAWSLGMQALDASEEYGWDRWMDGGTRLAAFFALSRVDKVAARRLAFETLAQDGGGGARNLDEILPLLVDDVPVEPIWCEIESYVTLLFEGLEQSEEPPGFSTAREDDTPSHALAEFIATQLIHPCHLVAQAALRTAGQLLQSGSGDMRRAVEEVLLERPDIHDEALLLLEALARQNPQAIEGLRGAVVALLHSPSYSVRSKARDIAIGAGWEIGVECSHSRPLPAIYDFVLLQPRPDGLSGVPVLSTGVLPNSEDPTTLVRPFTPEFDAVAHIASLPKFNLYHRAVQIMGDLSPRNAWSAEGEESLRAILSSAGLKFVYRRPRAQLARRALFWIIAELIDAGKITEEKVSRLVPIVTFDDPELLLREPSGRPSEIASIVRRDGYRDRNAEWIERLEEVRPLVRSTFARGWKVLGEHTTLKLLAWEIPTEERFSTLSDHDTMDPEEFFENARAMQLRAYPPSEGLDSLLIRNNAYAFDTAGAKWIALNPSIARRLGWLPRADQPLAWVDGAGKMMVKTIWWTDGAMDHSPPSFDDEVGEGWLVVASPEAYEAITSRCPTMKRIVRVARHFTEEGVIERRVRDWIETAT